MRQTAGTLNRTWLAILGLLVLAAGLTAVLQAAGTLQTIVPTPPPGTKIVTGDLHAFFAQPWLLILFLSVSVFVGILALLWIIVQVPRKNLATSYHLQQEGTHGRTNCEPSVLAAAVREEINSLPEVVTSSVLIRGTAEEPDLTLKVTVNDQADIRALLRHLEKKTFVDLSIALEEPLHQRRIQIDVSTRTQTTGTATQPAGIVLL